MHISLDTAAIPLNYTGEFREILKLLFIIVTTKSVYFLNSIWGRPPVTSPPLPSSRWMCPCVTKKAGGVERSIFTIAGNRTEFLLRPARNQVTIRSKPSRPCLVQDNDHLFMFYLPPSKPICRSKEAETSRNFFYDEYDFLAAKPCCLVKIYHL